MEGTVSYLVRRLLWVPLILFIVSFFTFLIARLGPGDVFLLLVLERRLRVLEGLLGAGVHAAGLPVRAEDPGDAPAGQVTYPALLPDVDLSCGLRLVRRAHPRRC